MNPHLLLSNFVLLKDEWIFVQNRDYKWNLLACHCCCEERDFLYGHILCATSKNKWISDFMTFKCISLYFSYLWVQFKCFLASCHIVLFSQKKWKVVYASRFMHERNFKGLFIVYFFSRDLDFTCTILHSINTVKSVKA